MTEVAGKTLADLSWDVVVGAWAQRCATARGAQAVRAHPLFDDPAAARNRVAEISEARQLAASGAALPLGGIADVAGAVARVRKAAALEAAELVAVAETGRALTRLRAHLRGRGEVAPRLAERGHALLDLGHVYLPILDAFDADGRLVDHASDALGPLRRALAAITTQLDRRMEGMLSDERFAPYLQDGYYTQRDDRYVLPIRTDGKGFVRGIVHGTSQSGQTLFIEPDEIVELNNRKKLAECDVADEERRILARFSGWIAEEADGFDAGLAIAETLDVIAAAAVLADDLVASAPVIDDAPRLALLHARHPLMLLAQRRCVANDLELAAGHTLVISGPNAGGKTVALKAAGLAALMARAGLHVVAESGSVVGWFTDVRTDVGDAQSLEHDLSTFTGHIVNLGQMLAAAGPGLLVLIDEIAVGTDPEQGAALAQATLEALATAGATVIVTTHYERLKVLGATDPRFANAAVGYDLARMAPTFKLLPGTPGSSGALAVARRTGLPAGIVERAQAWLGDGGVRVDELLATLVDQRRRLEEERVAVLDELEAVEAERAAAQRTRFDERAEQQVRSRPTLRGARSTGGWRPAASWIRSAASCGAAKLDATAVQARARRIAVVAGEVARREPAPVHRQGGRRDGELVVGAPVIVPSLGGRATIAAPPVRGKVEVQLGRMRALVEVAEVQVDRHRAAQRAARPAPAAEASAATAPPVALVDARGDGRANARTVDTTLDVRGQRADEAVAAVERFIDEGLVTARESLFVVHGHGTGALRTADARTSPVTRGRSLPSGRGLRGRRRHVTVLWLRD
ncbi:MAG: Smr/MutS family protein [Kofleriaceae bacterium]